MNIYTTASAVALRLLLGWYMLYAGLEKVFDPAWTAQGFLLSAKTFPSFYAWFAMASNSWWVDPLNSWGITLVGAALILGVGIRIAGWAGAMLMLLYYFPHYVFPTVPHGFIVEEHIIYAVAFILITLLPAAYSCSLGTYLRGTFLGRIPYLGPLL